jgi:hypothetical protein
MIDARIFPNSLDKTRSILLEKKAVLKGDYFIHDMVYRSSNPEEGLEKVFLRLRSVPKNIWNEKPFIVAIKNTDIRTLGKLSIIPVKEQFDTKEGAMMFIKDNYSQKFIFDYEFSRSGEQWFLGEDGIDLEDIEGHPSIEFKSNTEEGLRKLLEIFDVHQDEVIRGPSVVAIRDILR